MSDGKFMLAKWSVAGEILERGVYFTISFCRHPIRYGRRRIGGGRDPFLFSSPPHLLHTSFPPIFVSSPSFPISFLFPQAAAIPFFLPSFSEKRGDFRSLKGKGRKGGSQTFSLHPSLHRSSLLLPSMVVRGLIAC